jgi:hypothetical protein
MASARKLSTIARNILANSVVAEMASGEMHIYDAAPPANPQAAYVGTELAVIALPAPAFAAAVTGTISKSGVWSGPVSHSGTAAGFRLINGGGDVMLDGTAGVAGDTPDAILDNKTLVSGGSVVCTAFAITVPES